MSTLNKTIIIDNTPYTITLLGGEEAVIAFAKISPLLIPLVGICADELTNASQGYESSLFTSLSAAIAHGIREPDVLEVIRLVLKDVQVGSSGKVADINEQFRGNFKGYLRLAAFALKENFWDFVPDLLALAGLKTHLLVDLKNQMVGALNELAEKSIQDVPL